MFTQPVSSKSFRILLVTLLVLPAGCYIHSEAPLSDPVQAKPNEKLLGKWKVQAKDSGLTLTAARVPAAGYPQGVMLLSFSANPTNYTLFFCTELKGKTYVNLCGGWVQDPAALPAWDKARTGPFDIVKYAVADNTLTVWSPNEAVVKDAIARGKLKGIPRMPPPLAGPSVTLQDSTVNLVQFVLTEDAQLFPTKGLFMRID